jgi:hypothetical protein
MSYDSFSLTGLTSKMDSFLLNWYTCLRHALLHNLNHRKSLAYLTLTCSSSGTQNLMLHIISFGYRLSVNTFPKTGHHSWCFDSLLESREVTFWTLHNFPLSSFVHPDHINIHTYYHFHISCLAISFHGATLIPTGWIKPLL